MQRKKILKRLNYFSLIFFPIVAMILLAFPIAYAFPHILSTGGLPIFLFVCLPFTILAIILFILIDLLQKIRGKVAFGRRKYLYIANLLLSLGIISCALFFVFSVYTEKPPQFFPFDDKDATYTVIKENNLYWIKYSSPSMRNAYITCETGEGKSSCRREVDHDVTSVIASSPRELESLLEKSVRVSGEFISTKKQCIANTCEDIGNWAGLRIDTIELRK